MLSSIDLTLLKHLCLWHATPGDETPFLAFLEQQFSEDYWKSKRLGYYGLVLSPKRPSAYRPSLLICAHADSPGFIIQSVDRSSGVAQAVSIGYPHVEDVPRNVMVRCSDGVQRETVIYPKEAPDDKGYSVDLLPEMSRGDRLAFSPFFEISGDEINGTFLDNRLGCFLLVTLGRLLAGGLADTANVSLAFSTGEEFTGFGASVIAHALSPDFTVCLDATYSDEAQGIAIGGGPVVTLTDKSILLPEPVRRTLQRLCTENGLPLQEEIYNFSGTDARAFPSAGIASPVLPLLLATTGNHSHKETCSLKDIGQMLRLLTLLCQNSSTFIN